MTEDLEAVVALVTAPDTDVARSLAEALLRDRLAACVNILPALTSLYWWEGELEEGEEVLLLIKARRSDIDAIGARVKELHPYDVPELIATQVVGGLAPYLEWVHNETDRSRSDEPE